MRAIPFVVLIILSVVCGGCLGSGSLKSKAATLAYDGSENGTHQETTKCDDEGHIAGSGKVTDGRVRVTVTDGDGETKFEKAYEADFDLPSSSITGKDGTWTLKAARTPNDLVGDAFSGNYRFTLTC